MASKLTVPPLAIQALTPDNISDRLAKGDLQLRTNPLPWAWAARPAPLQAAARKGSWCYRNPEWSPRVAARRTTMRVMTFFFASKISVCSYTPLPVAKDSHLQPELQIGQSGVQMATPSKAISAISACHRASRDQPSSKYSLHLPAAAICNSRQCYCISRNLSQTLSSYKFT